MCGMLHILDNYVVSALPKYWINVPGVPFRSPQIITVIITPLIVCLRIICIDVVNMKFACGIGLVCATL